MRQQTPWHGMQFSGRYDDHLALPQVCRSIAEKNPLERLTHPRQPVVSLLRGGCCWAVRQTLEHESGESDLARGLLGRTGREPAYRAIAAYQHVQLPLDVDQLQQLIVTKLIKQLGNDRSSRCRCAKRPLDRHRGCALLELGLHVPAAAVRSGAERFGARGWCPGTACC